MPSLSASQKAFVRRMTEGEEFERHGVDLLVQQQRFEFFDELVLEGLFAPERNPRPVPADKEGYFRIPYWHILDYLKASAEHAGHLDDITLAEKVIKVIRAVSRAPIADGKLADNYHTTRVFMEILGLVPTRAVTVEDIELIPLWLGGQFDRRMVGHALAKGTLERFVGSKNAADWAKACRIIYHATAIQWNNEKGLGIGRQRPESLVDDYWLKDLISKNAAKLGCRAGKAAVTLFLERTKQVYSQELDRNASWLLRPAIEKHEQNHTWDGITNIIIDGLRDVLLSWVDVDERPAKEFVSGLLEDEAQIVRRIAIHVVDEKFAAFRNVIPNFLTHFFSDFGHLHETYRLLQSHFHEFTPDEQKMTLKAIRSILVSGENQFVRQRRTQRIWLSAIQNRGSIEADAWFTELQGDPSLKGMSSHPDFHSYTETFSGFGNSPYNVQQLLAFTDGDVLIDALNAFVPTSHFWDRPTIHALTDMLVDAVVARPELFLTKLPLFKEAKRPYQYAVISGLKKVWDDEGKRKGLDWGIAWPKLLDFFAVLIMPDEFWNEILIQDKDLSPNRDWIPPLISEFIHSGTRDDKTAFDNHLLIQAWEIVQILVNRTPATMKADTKEAMTSAINSSKGKALEAMINCALRRCRVRHKDTGAHDGEWITMQSFFDAEIAKCRDDNFEFSTLAGAYFNQFRYLNADWITQNFSAIFPLEFPANCLCALDGLAFSSPTVIAYENLSQHGVLAWVLRQEMAGSRARKFVLQRIALAYLWDKEPLNGSYLGALFDVAHEADLVEIASYFWSVSNQKLEPAQIEKILTFWLRCVEWSDGPEKAPASLLSTLAMLSCYLSVIGPREQALLEAVACSVAGTPYNAHYLLDALNKFAPDYPEAICNVFGIMLSTYKPTYDFQDRIKGIITILSKQKSTRPQALMFANQLSEGMPEMLQLYKSLVDTPPS